MNKEKLFLDIDGTITDSIKAYCQTYSDIYQFHDNFKQPDWTKVEKWDLSDQCPLETNPEYIFSHHKFFKYLNFIDEDMKDVLFELSRKYQIIIVSIGTAHNLAYKSVWLNDNLPFIKDYILLRNNGCIMDKSMIDMSKGIFVDDVDSNLLTSNARWKICFKNNGIKEWNQIWSGEYVTNSLELLKKLL